MRCVRLAADGRLGDEGCDLDGARTIWAVMLAWSWCWPGWRVAVGPVLMKLIEIAIDECNHWRRRRGNPLD